MSNGRSCLSILLAAFTTFQFYSPCSADGHVAGSTNSGATGSDYASMERGRTDSSLTSREGMLNLAFIDRKPQGAKAMKREATQKQQRMLLESKSNSKQKPGKASLLAKKAVDLRMAQAKAEQAKKIAKAKAKKAQEIASKALAKAKARAKVKKPTKKRVWNTTTMIADLEKMFMDLKSTETAEEQSGSDFGEWLFGGKKKDRTETGGKTSSEESASKSSVNLRGKGAANDTLPERPVPVWKAGHRDPKAAMAAVSGTRLGQMLFRKYDVGERTPCVRYVILTMQRSGSTWLLNEIPKQLPGKVRATWEAFNIRQHQTGNQMLSFAGLVGSREETADRVAMLNFLGAYQWATVIWNHLEKSNEAWLGPALKQQCAVGFKMMGPEVDHYSLQQTEDVLRDPNVKKVMLYRNDTYAQWLSRQWACWSNDFGSHKNITAAQQGAGHFDWKEWTEARAKSGRFCKCGQATKLEWYSKFKEEVFSTWREELSGQNWLELQTEELNDPEIFKKIDQFLFAPVQDATNVPLNQEGYETIASMKNNGQMRHFVERVVAAHNGRVKNPGGLTGLVPYYSGVSNVQNFQELMSDLSTAKWVVDFDAQAAQTEHARGASLQELDSDLVSAVENRMQAMHREEQERGPINFLEDSWSTKL